MARRNLRLKIDKEGRLEAIDPGFDCLELLTSIDPGFQVRSADLPGFCVPRIRHTLEIGSGFKQDELRQYSDASLWGVHDAALKQTAARARTSQREASLVDVKIELARRVLSHCDLCAHRCGVNRSHSEAGKCRLTENALVAEHFVHIGEEPLINPSLILNLAGCGLRCRFCQQWVLLNPRSVTGDALDASLWPKLECSGARSMSFAGGNPDESIYAILRFLASTPPDWELPIVWNSHGYSTPESISFLNGIVDAYIPDFKYGSESCGVRLSGIRGYPKAAESSIHDMLSQAVPVIVRILVLPDHVQCCHLPTIDLLSQLNSERLFVSIREQYSPDFQINEQDGALTRRSSSDEVATVRERAVKVGLQITG